MRKTVYWFFLFSLVLTSVPIASYEPRFTEVIAVPGRIDRDIPQIHQHRAVKSQTSRGYPWQMRPDIYGITPPPDSKSLRFPAEFESSGGILLGWPSYVFNHKGELRITELRDIVRHSIFRTQVSIIAQRESIPLIEKTLRDSGINPEMIQFVKFDRRFPDSRISKTLDTVWIRDYGPQFVFGVHQNQVRPYVIDMSYFPFPWYSKSRPLGRVLDDAVPGRVAESWGLASSRPPLAAEGGELLTDGRGTCLIGDRVKKTNLFLTYPYDRNGILRDYFGCKRVIVLKGLKGEDTGHLDMFLTVVSSTTLFVGEYDPSHDRINAERLNSNAQILKNAGYRIKRIPMPMPYSISGERVWATYTNALRIPGAVLVPVYRNPEFPKRLRKIIQTQERKALQEFRSALPGVSVLPVIADPLIPYGGSLHCIAINYPQMKHEMIHRKIMREEEP